MDFSPKYYAIHETLLNQEIAASSLSTVLIVGVTDQTYPLHELEELASHQWRTSFLTS